MARLTVIPEKYYEEIYKKSQDGLNCAKINDWLVKEFHLVASSSKQVARILRKYKLEKKELAQTAFAEAAAATAERDLEIFDKIISKFEKEITKAFAKDDQYMAAKLADTMFKFQSKRIDMSGHNLPVDPSDLLDDEDQVKEDILRKANILTDSN